MGQPLRELTPAQSTQFAKGLEAFQHQFTQQEGLGPIFNAGHTNSGCAGCHTSPAIGGQDIGLSKRVIRFGQFLSNGSFNPMTSSGGSLWQNSAISVPGVNCAEVIPAGAVTNVPGRMAGAIFGDGLIEAISDKSIADLAATAGVSGRVHMVVPLESAMGGSMPSPLRVGRFGWKAQVATIKTFSHDAALNEMGITSDLMPAENAPNGNMQTLAACDSVADPETTIFQNTYGYSYIDSISTFQRYLAPPPQTPRSGMKGEKLFKYIGCESCHHAEFRTALNGADPLFAARVVKPYSDFLLHDMGDRSANGLGDGIPQGEAQKNEMRTTPLWGIARRGFIGHDGEIWACPNCSDDPCKGMFPPPYDNQAASIVNVVNKHRAPGSEARTSAQQFFNLSCENVLDINRFLKSLGRAEFDFNSNGVVDSTDMTEYGRCLGSVNVTADAPCAIFDFDQNGIINQADLDYYTKGYVGQACASQIDSDYDGVPDCADRCPSDATLVDPGASCTCQSAHLDSDGDGFPDCVDGCPLDATTQAPLCQKPPVFTAIPPQIVGATGLVWFVVKAIDPEGTPVTLRMTQAPLGASFGAGNLFTWSPSAAQEGSYTVQFSATDRPVGLPAATSLYEVSIRVDSGSTSKPVAPSQLMLSTTTPDPIAMTKKSVYQARLTWTDNANDERGFTHEFATAPTGPFTKVTSLLPNITQSLQSGLRYETTYYFRVCAFNVNGSSCSNVVPYVRHAPVMMTTTTVLPLMSLSRDWLCIVSSYFAG